MLHDCRANLGGGDLTISEEQLAFPASGVVAAVPCEMNCVVTPTGEALNELAALHPFWHFHYNFVRWNDDLREKHRLN
jgi:hypothetical protein